MVLSIKRRGPDHQGQSPSGQDQARASRSAAEEIERLLPPIAVERVPPRSLTPSRRNARKHGERQVIQIAASIKTFGFLVPLLIDEQGEVIAGHGRLLAAQELDLPEVPVLRVSHLTDAQKRAYRLADNRLAELSAYDEDLLKIELTELDALDLDFDIEITGFDTVDLDRLTAEPEPAKPNPDDAVPALASEAVVTRAGDVWVLGDHRVICGDATDPEVYTALMGKDAAQMVFADAPYNIPIKGNVTKQAHREFPMASGEMSRGEFAAFLERVFRNLHGVSQDGAIHYVCMDWRHIAEITAAGAAVYGDPKQVCVWAKTNAGMGTFYRSAHELVFVFKVGDAAHVNNFGLGARGRYRSNVWTYAGATAAGGTSDDFSLHPTVKPVAMVIDAIKDCSNRGGIILDPFGGSGTTLIAAHRTKRVARLIELDPAYVDVTIRRWQKQTQGSAVEAATGLSFEALAAEREAHGHHDDRRRGVRDGDAQQTQSDPAPQDPIVASPPVADTTVHQGGHHDRARST